MPTLVTGEKNLGTNSMQIEHVSDIERKFIDKKHEHT
jgi:hypothetical protein